MKRMAIGGLGLAVLVLAVLNLVAVVAGAPVFTPSLRAEAVSGGWQAPQASAHYNAALYDRQLAEGYLRADVIAGSGLPDEALAIARAGVAADLLRKSLSLAPGDAFAWTTLAWAQALQGQVAEARATMAVSWRLAPYNAPLAQSRLTFAEFLAQGGIAGDALSTAERLGIRRDIRTVSRFRPGLAQMILAASPTISELHRTTPDGAD